MAARILLPARRGYACEVLRLAAALRDVFDLRVAIKKEASRSPRTPYRSAIELASWLWAPRTGFEPVTYRLTAGRSTVELSRNRCSLRTLAVYTTLQRFVNTFVNSKPLPGASRLTSMVHYSQA